jgi:TRAP-type C4-dicarboxylate transport system substrate-binding protein
VFRALGLLALIGSLAIAGCGGDRVGGRSASGHRVLTLLSPIGNTGELAAFGEQVAKTSGGSLRLRVVYAGHGDRRDYEAATIRDVQRGRAPLAAAGSRAWGALGVRALDALGAPLLIDSYELEERVLSSSLAPRLLAGVRRLGLVGIGILPGPMRKPVGATRALLSPADFRGRFIGTQQSPVADATVRALGGRPVRMPADPTLSGVDGVESQVAAVYGQRLDQPRTHLTSNVNFWPRPFVLVANGRAWAGLTEKQRDALRQAVAVQIPKSAAAAREDETESAAILCRRANITFDSATPPQLHALRGAVDGVYADLERDADTRAAINTIEGMKRDLGQAAAAVPRCASGGAAQTSKRTVLDGTWRMDTSKRAAAPDFIAENWGHWIFVFDRGRFADTQENRDACTWGYGTYSVRGQRMTWRFIDGGGEAPNGAENKPGEEFVFGFSAFHDTLTVSPVKGAVSPLNFRDRPWRRLSTKPSPERFSRRCPPPAKALGG